MSFIQSFRVKREVASEDVLEVVSLMPIYEYQVGFNKDRLPLLVKEIAALLKKMNMRTANVLPVVA